MKYKTAARFFPLYILHMEFECESITWILPKLQHEYRMPSIFTCPRLVASTSTFVWEEPKAFPKKKHLSNVGDHPIAYIMDKVTPEVVDILDSKSVSWTSIDVVRIGYEEEETSSCTLDRHHTVIPCQRRWHQGCCLVQECLAEVCNHRCRM